MSKKKEEFDKEFEEEVKKINKEWFKIKNKKIKPNNLGIDQDDINNIINNLSKYRDLIGCGDDGMLVINGLTGYDYLDKIKELQKMIKKLKNGECDKIINLERYFSIKSGFGNVED